MSRPVRVGLVGSGFVARIHADGYRRLGTAAVVLHAVCASRPERGAAFAHEFGVAHAVADLDAILNDPAIDLVDLCVPNICTHHSRSALRKPASTWLWRNR